jgi:hypothetical protein
MESSGRGCLAKTTKVVIESKESVSRLLNLYFNPLFSIIIFFFLLVKNLTAPSAH